MFALSRHQHRKAGPRRVGYGLRQKPRYEVTRAVTDKDMWAGETAKDIRNEEETDRTWEEGGGSEVTGEVWRQNEW